jgi:hypothetical protein
LSESSPPGLRTVFGTFLDIARLRRGPEDLPVSARLLLTTVVVYVLVDALMLAVLPVPANPAALVAIDVAVTLLWYGMVLRLAGKPERFLQTATAVMGFQLVMAPALVVTGWLYLKYQGDSFASMPVTVMRVALEIWMLAVFGRMLRSATAWPMFLCIILAIGQELVTFVVVVTLFPSLAKS